MPAQYYPRDVLIRLQTQRLYKRILRAHRKNLPFEMRTLGDDYVKAGMSKLRYGVY
jgi:hypothetical protein